MPISPSDSTGSTHLMALMSRYPAWAFSRLGASNSGNVALTVGILDASVTPRAVSCCCTWLTIGPMLSTTWPLTALTAPLPCPDSTLTTLACAARFASTHKVATAGLATILATAELMNPLIPLAIGPEKLCTSVANRGR